MLRLRSPALRTNLGGALFLDQAFALLAEETGGHECLIDLLPSLGRRLVLATRRDSPLCSGDEGLESDVDVGLNVVRRSHQMAGDAAFKFGNPREFCGAVGASIAIAR